MKKNLNLPYYSFSWLKMLLLFSLVFSLLGRNSVMAQSTKRYSQIKKFTYLQNQGEIGLTYMVEDPSYHQTLPDLLGTLKRKIDLGEFKNPKIKIKIEVIKLKDGYVLDFCPACLSSNIYGFSRKPFGGNRNAYKLSKKGQTMVLTYEYNKKFLVDENEELIKLGFKIFRDKEEIKELKYSEDYDLIPEKQLQIAEETANEIVGQVKDQKDQFSSVGKKDQTQSDNINKTDNLVKDDKELWRKINVQVGNLSGTKSKIEILRKNKGRLKTAAYQKKAQHKIAQLQKEIKHSFIVTTEFAPIKNKNKNKYIFNYSGTGDYKPKIENSNPGIIIIHEGIDKAILEVPTNFNAYVKIKLGDFHEIEREIFAEETNLKILSYKTEGNQIIGDVIGGKGDSLQLHVLKAGSVIYRVDLKSKKINISTKDWNIPSDTYRLRVYDPTTGHTINLSNDYKFNKGREWTELLPPLILLVIILGMIRLAYWIKERKTPDTQYLDKLREKGILSSPKNGLPYSEEEESAFPTALAGTDNVRKKIKISSPPKGNVTTTTLTLTNKSILQLEEVGTVPAFLYDQQKPDKYRLIRMSKLWHDSIVGEIYIHEICAARIHNWVFKDNIDGNNIKEKNLPEIGGWILGKVHQDKASQKYQVSFERFVEIYPENQSETAITFGTKAWNKLETQKEIYDNEFELVGWFHTHPGWGVFLSNDDLNTHRTFFQKPYQIAMELDSVRNNNEVGFFSRQSNNTLNNKSDLINQWYVWDSFSKDWLKES